MGPRFTSRTLFVSSVLFIVYATTIPWDLTEPPSLDRVEWAPLWDVERGRLASIPDLVQNVVLFLPFGFFGALGLTRARRATVLGGATIVGLLGLALSVIVEALQTMSAERTSSTSDVVTNTAGAVLGAIGGLVWARALDRRVAALVRAILREQPGMLVLLASTAAVIAAALGPFLPTLDVSALRAAARALLDDPWGSKGLATLLGNTPPWIALGFLAARELAPRVARSASGDPSLGLPAVSRAFAALVATTSVSALALALEAAQLFFVGHGPRVQDAVVAAGASVVGALVAITGAPVGPARALGVSSREHPALVFAFALATPALRALAPFELVPIEEKLASFTPWQLVPFWALFDHLTLWTFSNVFEAIAVFVPLAWALRATGRSAAASIAVCAATAIVLEVLQLGVRGRTFDVTEALYGATAAVVVSFVLARLSDSGARPLEESV